MCSMVVSFHPTGNGPSYLKIGSLGVNALYSMLYVILFSLIVELFKEDFPKNLSQQNLTALEVP